PQVRFHHDDPAAAASHQDRGEHGCGGCGALAVPRRNHAEELRMIGRGLSRGYEQVRAEPLIGLLDLRPQLEVDRARRRLVLASTAAPEGPGAPASSAVAAAIAIPVAAGAVRSATASTVGVGFATLRLELLQCVVYAAHLGLPRVIRARSSARGPGPE